MAIFKSDHSNMFIIQGISTLDKLIKQFHILTTNPRLISNATQFAHNFWEIILLHATRHTCLVKQQHGWGKNITYSSFFPKTRISGDFSELSTQEATFLLNDKHRLSLCVPKIGRKESIWVVAEYDQHTLLNNSRGKYIDVFSALCSHFGYIITQK